MAVTTWAEPLLALADIAPVLKGFEQRWGPTGNPRRGLGAALLGQLVAPSEDRDRWAWLLEAGSAWSYGEPLPDAPLHVDEWRRLIRARYRRTTVQSWLGVLPDLPDSPLGEGRAYGLAVAGLARRLGADDDAALADVEHFGRHLDGGEAVRPRSSLGQSLAACGPVPRAARRHDRFVPHEVSAPPPGKRLRSRLLLALAGKVDWAVDAAQRVEDLHTASLILDDLMDGSPLRRGVPALHIATDVPFAVVEALKLVRRALDPGGLPDVAHSLLVRRCGDLVTGQLREWFSPPTQLEDCLAIHRAKTGSLFSLAAELGALAADRPLAPARRFGVQLGVAFQIVDDVLDRTSSAVTLGKPAQQDAARGLCTVPALLGEPAALHLAETLLEQALAELPDCPAVLELARSCVRRST